MAHHSRYKRITAQQKQIDDLRKRIEELENERKRIPLPSPYPRVPPAPYPPQPRHPYEPYRPNPWMPSYPTPRYPDYPPIRPQVWL